MPWNNQNNGGPWGGGGNNGNNGDKKGEGSPWGSGKRDEDNKSPFGKKPSGGGGVPPKMPDMDDVMRKGQDFFKKTGGGLIALIIIVVLVVFWLFQCFYTVQQNEEAIILRFGKPQENVATNGLHFRFWPIDTYQKVPLTEQTISIGGNTGTTGQQSEGLMLSGDQNIVYVNFSVYYTISNPVEYLFNVENPYATTRQVAESAMREIVGRRPIDDIYRDKREEVADDVKAVIQATVNKYQMGIKIGRVSIKDAAPPSKVAAAFNSVQQAGQQKSRMMEEGNRERASKLGVANGQASTLREAAIGEKAQIIAEAEGRANRFSAVAAQAKEQPEIARFRLYMETMSGLLSQPNKMVLDQKNSSAIPYLPLNELLSKASGANSAPSSTTSTRPNVSVEGK